MHQHLDSTAQATFPSPPGCEGAGFGAMSLKCECVGPASPPPQLLQASAKAGTEGVVSCSWDNVVKKNVIRPLNWLLW